MGFDECFQLGSVIKTHGLRGELVFFLDVDEPSAYSELESVFVEFNGKLVPFFVESFHPQGNRAIVALEEVTHIDEATKLVGHDLYLPLKALPKLKAGQYYFHDLIDLQVFQGDQLIGTVSQVYQMPMNNLLGVMHKGQEVLVPMVDEILLEVDVAGGTIHVDIPDGLLDVYLEP